MTTYEQWMDKKLTRRKKTSKNCLRLWTLKDIPRLGDMSNQVSNRIKRADRRWSEKGLLSWLKVTFHKIFKRHLWAEIWSKVGQVSPRKEERQWKS